MKEENKNQVNEQSAANEQATANEQQNQEVTLKEVEATWRKITWLSDSVIDMYNDDPDMTVAHVLMGFGIFINRFRVSLEEGAITKDGEQLDKQNPKEDESFLDSALSAIKKGYEIGKSYDAFVAQADGETGAQTDKGEK